MIEEIAYVFSIGFFVTYLLTPIIANIAKKYGLTRPDVHKPGNPQIPTLGGLALYFGLLASLGVATLFFPDFILQITAVLSSATILAIVGLIDDIKILPGKIKTASTILAILPIAIIGFLYPKETGLWLGYRPIVPLVGSLRLTIIYWLLLPLAVAGPANAVNMIDILNGLMTSTSIVTVTALILSATYLGNKIALVLFSALLGALAGFLPYNKFPSRVFAGDSGGLLVGGTIGAIAILSKMEFITLIALMPEILNAFYIVSSIKGFIEHRNIKESPTFLLSNYKMRASEKPNAPITLTRIILLFGGDASEQELIRAFVLIQLFSSILALITTLLLRVKI